LKKSRQVGDEDDLMLAQMGRQEKAMSQWPLQVWRRRTELAQTLGSGCDSIQTWFQSLIPPSWMIQILLLPIQSPILPLILPSILIHIQILTVWGALKNWALSLLWMKG